MEGRAMKYTGIGLHINPGYVYNPALLHDRIQRLRPRTVNLIAAEAPDRVIEWGELYLREKWVQRVIVRNMHLHGNPDYDTNNYLHHMGRPEEWVNANETYLKRGFTVLCNNEPGPANMAVVADWEASACGYAASKGWKLAVGRTSTGNPRGYKEESGDQYVNMTNLWAALKRHPDLHVYSPNSYFDSKKTLEHSAGLIDRPMYVVQRFGLPVTSIGEYGTAWRREGGWIDPQAGWLHPEVGITPERYAELLIESWKTFYRPINADVCIYGYGMKHEWTTFEVQNSEAFFNALITRVSELEMQPPTPPVVVLPPQQKLFPSDFDTRAEPARVAGAVNLRSRPSMMGTLIVTIPRNAEIKVIRKPKDDETALETVSGSLGNWLPVVYQGYQGWIFSGATELLNGHMTVRFSITMTGTVEQIEKMQRALGTFVEAVQVGIKPDGPSINMRII
jgi:hypothetical protein